jgi:hypothetical protein
VATLERQATSSPSSSAPRQRPPSPSVDLSPQLAELTTRVTTFKSRFNEYTSPSINEITIDDRFRRIAANFKDNAAAINDHADTLKALTKQHAAITKQHEALTTVDSRLQSEIDNLRSSVHAELSSLQQAYISQPTKRSPPPATSKPSHHPRDDHFEDTSTYAFASSQPSRYPPRDDPFEAMSTSAFAFPMIRYSIEG